MIMAENLENIKTQQEGKNLLLIVPTIWRQQLKTNAFPSAYILELWSYDINVNFSFKK